jgi:hypothetical protein
MKTFITAITFFAFSSFTLIADKTYVWDKYKLQITVPDDFKVTKNNNTDFEMKGDGMELMMHIFEQNISVDDMDEAVIAGANAMKLEAIDAEEAIEGDGLDGYYVEGLKDGHRVMFAGMIDPKSRTNFFLVIIFADRDKQAEEDALEILESVVSLRYGIVDLKLQTNYVVFLIVRLLLEYLAIVEMNYFQNQF